MDDELHERVREVIASVPAGSVATYGDIASVSGAPSPRLVGRILGEDGHDLPWHRILRADGTPAPHLLDEQLQRLRAEGVIPDGQRVDLRKYRWQRDPDDDAGPGALF
ncbi:Alkylated DNA nucleotide flippase Atl1, participates in nucleotide excision repair, Ada-like DNA-binding domain [Amycolatopsis lurida]|uniref:DNA methyltransferase n=2 Tax=Amycolatopsis TaxID=1813 RepID=A0A2P2FS29_AMYLU|nr:MULTISPECIES: MGMT family protein [Amycolatopsis]RSN08867.1 DNA methyltransferase [Streptomyces sp. WAC 05977]KFU79509.1 DNA methyltransferase [Amycolatopsis lurida NRRL 2430]MBE1580137.1 alkylated DNA nucleotide flippase Atl1 [Amycolatopsis roodepoortensis]QXV59649.1 DNA methyltransferase [Amycolatopsis sp. TNS106]SED21514.1 Alkylated DNA nucleotide flippase Atl1, participates in nucleotide excision repair, Ada-like DNA-binding domain [Amycolatopsis lurida]